MRSAIKRAATELHVRFTTVDRDGRIWRQPPIATEVMDGERLVDAILRARARQRLYALAVYSGSWIEEGIDLVVDGVYQETLAGSTRPGT